MRWMDHPHPEDHYWYRKKKTNFINRIKNMKIMINWQRYKQNQKLGHLIPPSSVKNCYNAQKSLL